MTKNQKINALARLFYKMQGYNVEEGYRFDKARHPQERAMFEFAKASEMFWNIADSKSSNNEDLNEAMELLSVAGPNPILITEDEYFDRLHNLQDKLGYSEEEDD